MDRIGDAPDAAAPRPAPAATAVRRRWTAQRAYRSVLVGLGAEVAARWDASTDTRDVDALHDLRIALRRSRSVLRGARGVLPDRARDDALALAGALADLTGRARDLDVQLAGWEATIAALDPGSRGALEPVRQLLHERRDGVRDQLARDLAAIGRDPWRARWDELVTRRSAEGGERPDLARQPVGEVVAAAVARAHRRVLRSGRAIDAASPPEALHRLRKDAKRLRYLVEAFAPLIGDDELRRYVRRVRRLLDHLGAYQDAVVHHGHLLALDHELVDAPADTHRALVALVGAIEQRVAALRVGFADEFAAFDRRPTQRALDGVLADLRR